MTESISRHFRRPKRNGSHRWLPFLRRCTSASAACDALVHAPTHRLVVISACSRYKAVNPARLYALFVRVHTFLQQIDSLCNATAKTGDLLDFYNILHNQRCLSDTESERRKQCRTDNITFYSFYILIRQMSINQQFVIRGGDF